MAGRDAASVTAVVGLAAAAVPAALGPQTPLADVVVVAAALVLGWTTVLVRRRRTRPGSGPPPWADRPAAGVWLTAEASTAVLAVMGLHAADAARLTPTGGAIYAVVAGLGLLVAAGPSTMLVRRIGPKHAHDVGQLGWLFVAGMLAFVAEMPAPVWFGLAFLAGSATGLLWTCHRRLADVAPPGAWRHPAASGIPGALAAPLVVLAPVAAGAPRSVGLGILTLALLAAFILLRRAADPAVSGPTPLGRYLPWWTHEPRPMPWPRHAWLRWPGVAVYAVVTLALFFALPRDRDEVLARFGDHAYHIPQLFAEFPATLAAITTGVWYNHHPVQLVYVLGLLGLFGIWYEAREGTLRTAFLFFATTLMGGLTAGVLLHALHGQVATPWIDEAWGRPWAGGSAGAFGLMGAWAARAPRPWLALALMAFWEANVEFWFLQSFTAAFHVPALAAGYLLARHVLPPRRPSGSARTASSGPDAG